MNYEVCKYGKEWAIFDRKTRCYVLFGKKRDLEKRCNELNKDFRFVEYLTKIQAD